LPGGYRADFGPFSLIQLDGKWWTSTEDLYIGEGSLAYSFGLHYNLIISGFGGGGLKKHGFSVRCLRD